MNFVYELSDRGFEYRCCHLNFRYSACFEQGVLWHSGYYRVWIQSEMRAWHYKNIQSNTPYRQVLTTHVNYLVSLAKWLSVRLRTKWLWVRMPLLSLQYNRGKYQKVFIRGSGIDFHGGKPVFFLPIYISPDKCYVHHSNFMFIWEGGHISSFEVFVFRVYF